MSEELTYETGLRDGLHMIEVWENGQLDSFIDLIKEYALLRGQDNLSEYGCGILDAWEQHNVPHR